MAHAWSQTPGFGCQRVDQGHGKIIRLTRHQPLYDESAQVSRLCKWAMSNLGALGVSDPGILRLSRHGNIRTVRRHYFFPVNLVPRSHKPVASLLEVD